MEIPEPKAAAAEVQEPVAEASAETVQSEEEVVEATPETTTSESNESPSNNDEDFDEKHDHKN